MMNKCKNSLKHCTALLLTLLLLSLTKGAFANYNTPDPFYNTLTAFQDTTRPKATDTIPVKDSTVIIKDTFNLKISKDTLSAAVSYTASDSIVMIVKDKKIVLFSKANVKYTDVDLSADSIELDQPTKMVVATYRRDSLGNIVGKPVMVQADTKMSSDVIRYNFETQRGITTSTSTVQGEMFTQGEKVKKVSPTEYFAFRAQITTCNLDTPHFAFRTKRMKMVSQKLAVSGPIHPEFEGVPVPIYLPFGFFPLSQGRHSGLLPPQFTASEQFGLGLEGLGYYKVLNEYFDVTMRTNLYSYGGWALFVSPSYRKRYRFNGNLNLAIQRPRILSDNPKQEFTTARTFNITWSHTVDPRARPGTSFSANVNAGSTKFNQYIANNPTANFSNQLSSSITYSKTWGDKYNLTVSANHNQNNNTRIINMNLPNAAFTVNTFYPLQPKEFVGNPKWYHKLGLGLNTNFANQISFYDSLFSFANILDTMQWGAQHNVPIQLSLPPLGPINIAPGISFQERWHSRRFERRWNDALDKVDTFMTKGFYASREVAFSLGLNTALFGTIQGFGKNSKLMAIRHTVRPTISFSYKPDMSSKDFYRTYVDTAKQREVQFSYYDGSIFGPFSPGRFGGISFGIDNVLAMKLRNPKDTTEDGIKRVNIIDGFGFNGGYNFIADSFKLSTFNVYLRSTLFEKVNITASATLDPYQIDGTGDRIDRYAWQDGSFKPGRITNGNIAISTSFQSKPKDADKAKQQEQQQEELYGSPLTPEEQQQQLAFVRANPGEFADFNLSWSLSFSFSYSFSRQFKSDYSGFETISNANFNFNGDFNLTPKWKVGLNGFYDFNTTKLETLTMFISREMHCWQLSINVTPVGLFRTFNITISPKSGILRDLRINRTRYFYGT